MLLRDQRFNFLSQQRMRIGRCRVRTSLAKVEVFLVLQCLAGGAIRDPVGVVLVELLKAFDDGDRRTQHAKYPIRRRHRQPEEQRDHGTEDNNDDLEGLVAPLVASAMCVVPI